MAERTCGPPMTVTPTASKLLRTARRIVADIVAVDIAVDDAAVRHLPSRAPRQGKQRQREAGAAPRSDRGIDQQHRFIAQARVNLKIASVSLTKRCSEPSPRCKSWRRNSCMKSAAWP